MAEERDPLVSRRYRELGSEEPPPELDEHVLAGSRRRRPFQWHGPVAAAAVIVLAVAVTVHLEREQRDQEPFKEDSRQAKPYKEARPPEKKVEQPRRREDERGFVPAPPGARTDPVPRQNAPAARDSVRSEAAPQAPPPAAQEAPAQRALEAPRAPAVGAAADSTPKPMASPESRLAKSRVAELSEQPPERWLEGIAELRTQGRHEEADESLKRFRERHPDYQIPEEMLARIEKK